MKSPSFARQLLPVLLAWGLVSSASAQIGSALWAPQPGTFKIQSPYNLPVSDRYTFTNGIYHLWVFNTDEPFSEGDTTRPRTEQRFEPDYTSGEVGYQAQMMVPSDTSNVCIFQIHTGDAQSPTYGSTTFMLFWYSSDGGSVHDYSGTELANNLSGTWFQVNVIHNLVTNTIACWINGRLVWIQQDNGAGDFYLKDGVYMQSGGSTEMENYITNIHIWATSGSSGDLFNYGGMENNKSKLDVQVSGTSAVSGSPVFQSPFSSPAALWDWVPTDTGYFRLMNGYSNIAMTVQASSTSSQAPIVQAPYAGTGSDEWLPTPGTDGIFTFANRLSGMWLDDAGASTAAGKQLDQFSSNGGSNQQFYIDIPPAISPANTRLIEMNHSTAPIAFATTAFGRNPSLLAVTASSSNPSLIPAGNVVISSASNPWTGGDIGSVATTGNSTPGDIFTLNASGADIYGTADAGQFISQPMAGDGQLVARVTSIGPINAWAKGGVMMRSSTNANAAYAFVMVSASNGVAYQYRAADGGSAAQSANITGITVPCWVKLVKSGSNCTGFYALDNNGTPGIWTQIGGVISVNLDSSPIEGIAATAHNNTGPLSTSTYDNVSGPANSGANESVTITPATNASGQGVISLTVSDGTTSAVTGFNIEVNGPPTLSTVANQNIGVDGSTGALAFTVGDQFLPIGSLMVTASSSNSALFPPGGIVLGGTGASRTIDIIPAANQIGSGSIVLAANDGTLATGGTFSVSVAATPIQSWRLQYFGTVLNSGSASDAAEPQGDGVTNLQKFAFGMNPAKPGVIPATYLVQGGNLTLTYTRADAALSACTFSYPWSASPGGPWSTTGVTQQIVSDNGTVQTVQASVPMNGAPRLFMCVQVTGS